MGLERNLAGIGSQDSNFDKIALIALVIILSCIVFYHNSRNVELRIALEGWGPQDYVNQKLHPECFRNNWPSGILAYDNSLPMRTYYHLAKYFGINPTKTMYPFMLIQTLLFLFSVAFVTQSLFQNKYVTLISVVIISVSNLAGLNLSRFGAGYGSYLSFPLYYGYSNSLRMFALGFYLRNEYIRCYICLALSIYCHVNMGLFALVFIGAYAFYRPRLLRERFFIAGVLICLVLVAPHIFSIISNAGISSGGVPVEKWVKSTRLFSFHWYPITMKLFTKNANQEFFPFLLVCFFFFVGLRYQDIKDERTLKVIAGSIACWIISLFGVIFSEMYPVPLLIKISLQRSTGLITFFGVLYIIYYLWNKVESGKVLATFSAVYALIVMAVSKPGVAALPLLLLLYLDIKDGRLGLLNIEGRRKVAVKFVYFGATLLVLFLCATAMVVRDFKGSSLFPFASFIFQELWTPLQYFNPFYRFDFLLRGGAFKVYPFFTYLIVGSLLITGAIIMAVTTKKRILNQFFRSIFVVLPILTVGYLERADYLYWHKRYSEIASDYLVVQEWAANSIPKNALFMTDPTHYYGWRDFSQRSSFGNLREWGYCVVAYNPNRRAYEEGLERMREFGMDVDLISGREIKENVETFIYEQKVSKEVRKIFYEMTIRDFASLGKKYGIDYIVMNKRYHKTTFANMGIAYENDHFIVYQMKDAKA